MTDGRNPLKPSERHTPEEAGGPGWADVELSLDRQGQGLSIAYCFSPSLEAWPPAVPAASPAATEKAWAALVSCASWAHPSDPEHTNRMDSTLKTRAMSMEEGDGSCSLFLPKAAHSADC